MPTQPKLASYSIPTEDYSRPHLFLDVPSVAGEKPTPSDFFRKLAPQFASDKGVEVHDDPLLMPPDLPLPIVAEPVRTTHGHAWHVHRGPRRVNLFYEQRAQQRINNAARAAHQKRAEQQKKQQKQQKQARPQEEVVQQIGAAIAHVNPDGTTTPAASGEYVTVQPPPNNGVSAADAAYIESQRATRPPPRQEVGGGAGKEDEDEDVPPALHHHGVQTPPATVGIEGGQSLEGSPAGKMIRDEEGNVIGTVLEKGYTPPMGFGHKYTKEEIAEILAKQKAEDEAIASRPYRPALPAPTE